MFPTQFARNSHLMWLNGVLLKPGTNYTMPGAAELIFSYTLIGGLTFSGQPSQFISFKKAGEASASSLSSAAVLGMDMPFEVEYKPTMRDLFSNMEKELERLKSEIEILKGAK